MKIKVELSLSRLVSNRDNINGCFSLKISDDASCQKFMEVLLTPEQFADLLSNRQVEYVDAEVYNLDKVGKTMEQKVVKLLFNEYNPVSQQEALVNAIKDYNALSVKFNDGWHIPDQRFNHRDYDRNTQVYSTIAYRYT